MTGLTTCSEDREVYVGEAEGTKSGCVRRKWLHENGSITESKCVRRTCSRDGMPCYSTRVTRENVKCEESLSVPRFLSTPEVEELPQLSFLFETNDNYNFCCQNS